MAKTKKKSALSDFELLYIKNRSEEIQETLDAIKQVSQFKVGDFLIAFHTRYEFDSGKGRQVTNSYGAPKKYTVVYVDTVGIPYMKELNKDGSPSGILLCPVRLDHGGAVVRHSELTFEVDPDYADSIIMDDEANYNSTAILKAKSDLFKEITQHNKKLRVKSRNNEAAVVAFIKTLKVGDVFWRSIKTNITIHSLNELPLVHKGTRVGNTTKSNMASVFGTAIDSKGKIIKLNASFFFYRALYTGQPRSYNELKDPK